MAGGVAPTVEYRAAVVRTEEMVEAEAAAAADAELHKLREELDATRRRVETAVPTRRGRGGAGTAEGRGEALSRAKRARARGGAPPPPAAATARPRSAAEAAAELAKLREEHALLRRRSDELTVTVQLSRDEAESLRQQLLAPHARADGGGGGGGGGGGRAAPPTAEELSRLLLENEKLEAELAAKADARRADLTRAAALKREVAAMKAQLGVALGTLQQRSRIATAAAAPSGRRRSTRRARCSAAARLIRVRPLSYK